MAVVELENSGILPLEQLKFVGDWDLTGHGVAYDKCGSFFKMGCLESHKHVDVRPEGMSFQPRLDGAGVSYGSYVKVFRHRCFRQDCPICWRDWDSRLSRRSARRVESFHRFLVKRGAKFNKALHVVVSVPKKDYGLSVSKMRKKVYRALKIVNVFAGAVIYHPKRFNKYVEKWYFSPHFHVICFGFLRDIAKTYRKTGYVVKNLGVRKTVEGTFFYQLNHCGYKKNHNGVVWFGSLSYRKYKMPDVVDEDGCVCPFCGGKLRPIVWVGDGDCPVPDVDGYEAYGDNLGFCYKRDLVGYG